MTPPPPPTLGAVLHLLKFCEQKKRTKVLPLALTSLLKKKKKKVIAGVIEIKRKGGTQA